MNIAREIAGCRPFPVDHDRQERCRTVLNSCGMTITELAMHLGISKQLVSSVINGRQPSPTTERRIATFLGVSEDALFPPRTAGQIAAMREAERLEKARAARLKAERMKARELASEGAA